MTTQGFDPDFDGILPELSIPIDVDAESAQRGVGIIRGALQAAATDASNVGTIIDEYSRLPGIGRAFGSQQAALGRGSARIARDYEVMRVETAGIERPLRQAARTMRSIEGIARSTNTTLRIAAHGHRSINNAIQNRRNLAQQALIPEENLSDVLREQAILKGRVGEKVKGAGELAREQVFLENQQNRIAREANKTIQERSEQLDKALESQRCLLYTSPSPRDS